MPWEKSFDESEALDAAMKVFWEKGYAATSISDITEATGLKRGSLYNAFDGKQELFLQALLKYDGQQRARLIQELDGVDDACKAIEQLFDHCVESSMKDPEKKGCLLINTSLDYAQHDTEVQRVIEEAFTEMTEFFERTIRRGRKDGQIPKSVSPKSTARALLALLAGMRVLGRGTYGKSALSQVADQAKRLIS